MTALPTLPAPPEADPATVRPCIIVDTREQTPLLFTRLPSVRGTLQTGDYSAQGCEDLLAIERKSIADLVGCCTGDNRDRFTRELHRLRGFRFARLLIVGTRGEIERHEYRSAVNPTSVLHSLAAWEVRFVPIVWAPDPQAAAVMVEGWAFWFCRELVLNVKNLGAPPTDKQQAETHENTDRDCHLKRGR